MGDGGNPMYQAYWGLREMPFSGRAEWRWFYCSPTHEEALARLQFLVEQRRRVGLLLGASGSGKSLMLELFAGQLRSQGRPVVKMNLTGVGGDELLWLVALQLGIAPAAQLPRYALWQQLTDRLAEYRYQGLESVLLADDADAARTESLTTLLRLVEEQSGPESTLVVVLAARPDRAARIGPALLERAELRIDLEPWEEADTARFVQQVQAEAGRAESVFDHGALRRLHELAEGVPRRIRQLADLSLAAGAGRRLERIDAETVESVYHELGVVEV
ncbi:MAG TPA: AAA family ATPase [Planctomycetaceae bacterium]|nr:AAA family ATPase [Planctomycetaceae bacterium]